ncbi:MAG TPA: hypothetical protein VFC31_03765 [Candidatus Limnocylindria bacterium]|nr:hypothetical protein [Candidatus Limnocylindria bacterium]
MKTTQIVIAAVLGLALAGGGFAAGMTVGRGGAATAAPSASPSGGGGRFIQGGGSARGGGAAAGGQTLLTGRVLSVNDGSITVEVRQPGQQGASPAVTSEIVLVGTNTRVVKTTEAEIKTSDLKANDQIQIVGTTDATGNLSASAIVVGGNALQQLFGGQGGPGGQGGGGRGASPSPSPAR